MKKVLVGLLLLLAGLLLLAFNTGLFPAEYKYIVFSWPSLLIAIGITTAFGRKPNIALAVTLAAIGLLFMLKKLDIYAFRVLSQNIWPMLLITVGIAVTYFALSKKKCKKNKYHMHTKEGTQPLEAGYLQRNYLLGGAEESFAASEFKGGEITCLLGGAEIDLSSCQMAEGTHILKVDILMGGVVIYVPTSWHVELRQSSILGGFSDKRKGIGTAADKSRTLIIKTSCLLGGGELKYRE